MSPQDFQTQINRLIEQFGKGAYGTERCTLIWREVKDFDVAWFKNVIEIFLGDSRQAPLLSAFREYASTERERTWKIEKEKNRRESEAAIENIFDPQMIGSICQTIQDRITGRVPDPVYKQFIEGIRGLAPVRLACRICDDSGVYFKKDGEGYEWVVRCRCSKGNKRTAYPLEETAS